MAAKKNERDEAREQHPEEQVPETAAEETAAPDTKADSETPPEVKTDAAPDALAAEKERYLRLAAEYDNFRKRSARERENIYADVRADTITRFLPVYDNLERALKQETTDEAYKKGVEMTMTGLLDVLEKLGVAVFGDEGETFDPNMHNAVMHCEDENAGENTIVQVFQKGFRLGDKIIRFAMVKVAN